MFQHIYQFSFSSLPGKSFIASRKLGEWILEERRKYAP